MPQADPAQRSAMLLRWRVTDANKSAEPTVIEWAETPAGPWTPVAGSPSRTASGDDMLLWLLPEHAPPKVFLKFTASDAAGNKLVTVSNQPFLIDPHRPTARIQGFAATPAAPAAALIALRGAKPIGQFGRKRVRGARGCPRVAHGRSPLPPVTDSVSDSVLKTQFCLPAQRPAGGQLGTCLVHIYPSGPAMGRRYPLGPNPLTIGRGDDVDIVVAENSVSRRHARIEAAPGGYSVRDLSSTNGTYVNDAALLKPRQLADGDYLRVGNCIYRFLAGGNIENEYHEEIYRLAIVDGLTQLHNKRYLNDFLERELARSTRHARPLSVLLIDLDHFKAVNDTHGHLCGDAVLRELAERVRPEVRREDLFARYGGEEFAMALVESPPETARQVAERVREAVRATPFHFDGYDIPLTVSIGVATTLGGDAPTPVSILQAADDQLYEAKRAGRDRVAG